MNDVTVVPGEMYDWTDFGTSRGAAGGEAFAQLLAAVLPECRDALFIGPHRPELVAQVARSGAKVTLLVRGASDALRLAEELPGVEVVAGGLGGWVGDHGSRRFAAVVALDGLDRVGSNDEAPMAWSSRLAVIRDALAPDGTLVLAARSPMRAADLLDARPEPERHGDEEFVPIFSDVTRPGTLGGLAEALEADSTSAWYGFGAVQSPALLIGSDVLVDGPLAERARAVALSAHRHWLADPVELFRGARRAGSLDAVSDVWVAVTRPAGRPGDTVVALPSGETVVGWADDTTWTVESAESAVPRRFPRGESVEDTIFTLLESGDLPAVRELSQRIGAWVRATSPASVVFDQLIEDAEGFAHAWWAPTAEGASPAAVYLAAWRVTIDRLRREHRRHPWPPWVLEGSLFDTLASEAGFAPSADTHHVAVALAKEVMEATQPDTGVVNTRRDLADYEELHHQLFEAKGHIAGLERVLKFRDQQLRARDDQTTSATVTTSKTRRILAGIRKQLRPDEVARLARKAADVSSVDDLKEGARRVVRRVRRG